MAFLSDLPSPSSPRSLYLVFANSHLIITYTLQDTSLEKECWVERSIKKRLLYAALAHLEGKDFELPQQRNGLAEAAHTRISTHQNQGPHRSIGGSTDGILIQGSGRSRFQWSSRLRLIIPSRLRCEYELYLADTCPKYCSIYISSS